MVFAQTHDWISTKRTTVENCTHCSISHSEEIKYTADNSLSIREAVVIEDVRLLCKVVFEDVTSEKVSRKLLNMHPELSDETECEIFEKSPLTLWNYLWSMLINMLIETRTTGSLQ